MSARLELAQALALVAARTFVPMTDSDYMSFGGVESDAALISYGAGDDDAVVIIDGALVTVLQCAAPGDADVADAQTFELAVQS